MKAAKIWDENWYDAVQSDRKAVFYQNYAPLISPGSIIMCLSLSEILFVQTCLQLKQNPNLKRQRLAGATVEVISTGLMYKI